MGSAYLTHPAPSTIARWASWAIAAYDRLGSMHSTAVYPSNACRSIANFDGSTRANLCWRDCVSSNSVPVIPLSVSKEHPRGFGRCEPDIALCSHGPWCILKGFPIFHFPIVFAFYYKVRDFLSSLFIYLYFNIWTPVFLKYL